MTDKATSMQTGTFQPEFGFAVRPKKASSPCGLPMSYWRPSKEAAEAHRRLAAGGVRGRLVLDFF